MELQHEFTVPVPIEQAWGTLLDLDRVAPCMPGASLESFDGHAFTGKVKVKVGPITVTYRGEGEFVERDEGAHRAVIEARGKEARGTGTAAATITTELAGEADQTRVKVSTNLAITGRPAQFGRGVMNDVGAKLIGQFATCLADQLTGEPEAAAEAEAAAAPEAAEPTVAPQPRVEAPPRRPVAEAEPIDLLEAAGAPVLKRAAPVLGLVVLFILIRWLIRRRRRG